MASPNGNPNRDRKIYVHNLPPRKRYLSEMLASSLLNRLTVRDSSPDKLTESQARSNNTFSSSEDSPGRGPITTPFPAHGYIVSAGSSTLPPPRKSGSESEGRRFSSSPSDKSLSSAAAEDQRRAAVSRSVRRKMQPPEPLSPSDELLPFSSTQEPSRHNKNMEAQRQFHQVEDEEKPCKIKLNSNTKGDE